ncbi:PACE efflux transporter [Aliamphritea hakodatensis]|uniref:PACE efflux transporter n=1 Tax=Aliamphritea hakodatensis TaxID=2895352 RepID=UPI0022FD7855|nr:PACE efflux transporter [Aliamphritea hakodatensis]
MTMKERIIHMILFEAIALAMFVPLAMLATGNGAGSMTALSVMLSLIAMVWNFIYNWGFDCCFGDERLARTFAMRLAHGAGFELGMIVTSFPIIMWMLNLDFLTVLLMDIGAVTFFFFYAIIFNWAYDLIRARRMASAANT